jgi:hypothetical protein
MLTHSGIFGGANLAIPDARFQYFSTMGLTVKKVGGVYSHNYLSANFKPAITGITIYIDGVNGSDSFVGTNPLQPRKTFAVINGQSTALVHQFLVKGNAPVRHNGVVTTRSCVISSWDGARVQVVAAVNITPETWTATSGQAGVYETAFAATPYSVVDLSFTETWGTTDAPAYRRLALVASLVLCQSTAGSWFWDSGASKLYVHTSDTRAPDLNVIPTNNASQFTWVPVTAVSNPVFWMDQVDSIGGFNPILITEATSSGGSGGNINLRAYMNRCTAQICKDIGIERIGIGNTLTYRCGAYETGDDGFHYDGLNAASLTDPTGSHVEIEPTTYNCGVTTSTQANSSSLHSLGTCVTINPNFQAAWNRELHDILAAYRWLLGGSVGPSRQSTGSTSRSVVAGSAGSQLCKIFVDGTTVRPGSQYDLNTTGGCSILFKGGVPGTLTIDPANAGTIGAF